MIRPHRPDADKLKGWGAKWTAIRDNAATPEKRAYAEQYLEFLRGQLRKEIKKVTR